ncbi:MAG: tRNA (guanine(26)-N(2))-dimethyltransferase [Candidatus Methanoplasma sp.]|jgi:tRNA (guanine26-N2/guanine27-N2)-dimethyltransferase|nr:tRNA (guanine(26)-N(2))-dimethyltransferase [Candidatus Methanoplasma sp.]
MPEGVVVREASTDILVPETHSLHGPGKKIGPVFFNRQMAFNRDVSVMLLRTLSKSMTVADAMAATGSRSVRIANEVPGTEVVANDMSPEAVEYIDANIKMNSLSNCESSNCDMHSLFTERSFDYVDLDPFGSPAHFIQSSIRGCRKKGILAITATDTAPLAGAHAGKCRRRYQCEPIRGYMCHEGGLRILMCTIARELAKFDRGMTPLLSFYADHYFRTYVRVEEGADAADRSLGSLGYMHYDPSTLERSISTLSDSEHRLGPFWLGPLHSKDVLASLSSEDTSEERRCVKMLDLWRNEIDSEVFLYDMSELSSFTKMSPPKIDDLVDELRMHGKAAKTHMSPTSFKTDLETKDVLGVYRELSDRMMAAKNSV